MPINTTTLLLKALVILPMTAALSGCLFDNDGKTREEKLDRDLSAVISSQNLTGDPASGRSLPEISEPEAQLGMKLFFSKSLSGDQDTACVSCHHPALGGGDDLSLPIGVGADRPELLGPGRTHSGSTHPTVPRNAPTTFNIALWDQVLFHDGRVESIGKTAGMNGNDGQGIRTPDSAFNTADADSGLTMSAAQARFPVTSAAEMRGHTYAPGDNTVIRTRLEQRLQNAGDSLNEVNVDPDGDSVNNWVNAFEEVYDATVPAEDIITFERITSAIAAYENSQVFTDNRWANYIAGDAAALTVEEKAGAYLFFNGADRGGAGCSSCHSGDFFTDEGFHNIGMPQIGEGKGNGDNTHEDFGRMRETGNESDQFAFRTPSLLNVEHTGPFGHAGAYDSLEAVVRHHLNPTRAVDDYFSAGGTCATLAQNESDASCEDYSGGYAEENSRKVLTALEAEQAAGTSLLINTELSDSQINNLVAFLEALTDPCLEDTTCLSQWIPQDLDEEDGNRLEIIDQYESQLLAN